MSDQTATKVLDLKGLLCPMPVIKMAKAIKKFNLAKSSKHLPPTRVLWPISGLVPNHG
jgi:hypothetical protein